MRPDKDFESPHRGRWRRDESNRPFSTFQDLRLGETINIVSSHLGPLTAVIVAASKAEPLELSCSASAAKLFPPA